MLKVGVVGCGTIGGEICRAMDGELVQAALVGISDVDLPKAETLARSLKRPIPVRPLADVIEASDLVVEAASKAAAPAIIRQALERSKDVMVMSVGGLLTCADEMLRLAQRQGRRLYVPSGAIAGLDAIKGAMLGRVSKVTLTTRKPPRGLEGAPYVLEKGIDLKALRQPTIVFSGSAREAVPAFPANINVAAALSLAGIGADKTEVRIIADPGCDRNIHEIEAEGDFGRLVARMENVPSPHNPKTSYMAALSAIALLRRITESLVVGT
ncbi:MAG TPA: aspartate dehydrogenase [Candidatus Methylomirabilis sp.]|nr:aspartate dehydrogenase [Candidatus Methylomirabilis sp.]